MMHQGCISNLMDYQLEEKVDSYLHQQLLDYRQNESEQLVDYRQNELVVKFPA